MSTEDDALEHAARLIAPVADTYSEAETEEYSSEEDEAEEALEAAASAPRVRRRRPRRRLSVTAQLARLSHGMQVSLRVQGGGQTWRREVDTWRRRWEGALVGAVIVAGCALGAAVVALVAVVAMR